MFTSFDCCVRFRESSFPASNWTHTNCIVIFIFWWVSRLSTMRQHCIRSTPWKMPTFCTHIFQRWVFQWHTREISIKTHSIFCSSIWSSFGHKATISNRKPITFRMERFPMIFWRFGGRSEYQQPVCRRHDTIFWCGPSWMRPINWCRIMNQISDLFRRSIVKIFGWVSLIMLLDFVAKLIASSLPQRILSRTLIEAQKSYPNLAYQNLHSAYKKFDPIRGMDYQLHLNFQNPDSGEVLLKRWVVKIVFLRTKNYILIAQLRNREAAGSRWSHPIALCDWEH